MPRMQINYANLTWQINRAEKESSEEFRTRVISMIEDYVEIEIPGFYCKAIGASVDEPDDIYPKIILGDGTLCDTGPQKPFALRIDLPPQPEMACEAESTTDIVTATFARLMRGKDAA